MTEDEDRSSTVKTLVAKAKDALGKATGAVAGKLKKGDSAAADFETPAAAGEPSENSRRMKDAVEAARKARADD